MVYSGEEREVDLADRTVALLGDDQVGFPFIQILVSAAFAVQKHHHVGVLLDRPRFTQVGEGRELALGLAAHLREREHRDIQLARERLQGAADLGDLLVPGKILFLGRNEREIVDEYDFDRVVRLHAAGLGAQIEQLEVRGVFNIQRSVVQTPGRVGDLVKVGRPQQSGADAVRIEARFGGQQPLHQGHGRHLQRKEPDRLALLHGHIGGHGERQRGLAHRRPRPDYHELRILKPAGQIVEIGKPARYAGVAAARVVEPFNRIDGLIDDLPRKSERSGSAGDR